MRSTRPPKIARWLLEHFGCSPNNEAIIGDLDEQYRQPHSYLWYWRQALQAIVMSFFKELSAHKLLAIRALFVGWAIKAVWLGLFASSIFGLATAPPKYAVRLMPLLLASATSVAVCAMSAWLVSRVSGVHHRPMVLLYLFVEVVAVPIIIKVPISLPPIPFPAVIKGFYGPIAYLWPQPFATYINLGLINLGYPLPPIAALCCGSILMMAAMLVGVGVRSNTLAPPPDVAPLSKRG